jgi:pimeloyl-ACP methyl ester carboxylesterase
MDIRRLAIPALALALAVACSGGDGAPEPTSPAPASTPTPRPNAKFSYGPCGFEMPDGQEPGEHITCGTLTVPEDRADPASPTIDLAIAIFSASSDEEAPDPLIYLAGGPGGPALGGDTTLFDREFAAAIQRDRDIVFVDQRGVGRASPALTCPEIGRISFRDADDPFLAALDACRSRLESSGVRLAAYNSRENAADIADLAAVLGYDAYNVYGVSYGTRLALTMMRDRPAGIRSVILDSTLPLEVNVYAENPRAFEGALDAVFDACAADATCSGFAPNLRGRFFGLVDRLNASPVTVYVPDYYTAEPYPVLVDGDGLLSIVFQAMYVPDAIAALPALIVLTEQADSDLLGLYAYFSQAVTESIASGMYLSVQCHEEVPFNTLDGIAPANAPSLNASTRNELSSMLDKCAVWRVPPASPQENQPTVSDIPALVLAGRFDPITPPSYGRAAAQSLTRATYLEFPWASHGVLDEGCAMDIVAAFLDDPEVPPDASCVLASPPIEFESP